MGHPIAVPLNSGLEAADEETRRVFNYSKRRQRHYVIPRLARDEVSEFAGIKLRSAVILRPSFRSSVD